MKQFKSLISITLAVFIFLNTLVLPLIYLDFETRKEYIAKVLCINKSKPITMCGGKCYLAKQLNSAQNQQDDQQAQSNAIVVINFFFQSSEIADVAQGSETIHEQFGMYKHPIFDDTPTISIFQPPRFKA